MPEAATIELDEKPPAQVDAPSSGGTSLDDLAGGTDISKLSGGLADIKRREVGETSKLYDDLSGRIDRDMARAERLSRDSGVEAGNLRPWNEEYESAKRRTDPVEAFGSLGSAFGLIASAFTRTPMTNALNASAAAMNAVRAGDDKEYERAYKAWQDNNKLALDRHKIEHEQYTDALQLMNANMAAGQAKMRVLAAKFGDEKTLFLLDQGMDKEVIDAVAARQKLALGLAEAAPKIAEDNAKMADLLGDPEYKDPKTRPQALMRWSQRQSDMDKSRKAMTPEGDAYFRALKEKPDMSAEERADYIKQLRSRRDLSPDQVILNQLIEDNPEANGEQIAKKFAEYKAAQRGGSGGGNTTLTTDRQIASAQARKRQELIDQGKTPDEADKGAAEYARTLKQSATPPSANRRDDLASKISRVQYMEGTIDKVEELLKKHNAITGLGGKITRPAEIIGNVFGSNETDRKQFERYISELKEWAPRALTDSSGRPLSAEAGNVSNIIAGLSLGDTAANTARAYDELRKLLKTMKEDLSKRREGEFKSPVPGDKPTESKRKPSWQDAPEVQ